MPMTPRCRCWHPGNGKTKTGRLWCYVRDDRPFAGQAPPAVLYCYSPDRKGEHPRQHLAAFHGILQADGYAGLCRAVSTAASPRRRAGRMCGASSSTCTQQTNRRWRMEALQRIARTVRGRGDDPRPARPISGCGVAIGAERAVVRRIEDVAGDSLARISGKSDLAGAIRYALTRWDALTLVLRDGRACHRQQRRRTLDAADGTGAEELAVRRCRRWRVILPIWRCPYKVSRFCRGS